MDFSTEINGMVTSLQTMLADNAGALFAFASFFIGIGLVLMLIKRFMGGA